MRLRTLPLSLAGVVLGIMMACADFPERARPSVIIFTLLTTVCLQILSNLSNELGDFMNGTDTVERDGPHYSLSEGTLTVKKLKRTIVAFVFLCATFGLLMILFSFETLFSPFPILLLLLGAGAIIAALRYTLGKNPYGYRGWGDFFVFIFFGLVSVMGSYFVVAHCFESWSVVLPAVSIGLFSIGVLNVNNIRDMESDCGIRRTVPLRIGERNAKIYHTFLIVGGMMAMVAYHYVTQTASGFTFGFLPLFIWHLVRVWRHSGGALDKDLPMLVILTFLWSVFMGLDLVFSI